MFKKKDCINFECIVLYNDYLLWGFDLRFKICKYLINDWFNIFNYVIVLKLVLNKNI